MSGAGQASNGYSVLESIFVVGLIVTVSGIAVPNMILGLDEHRAAGAARYVSARLQRARMEAITRARAVAISFNRSPAGQYTLAVFIDGNHNGVLANDISRGIDISIGPTERLADTFAGIEFGALPGLPPAEPGGSPPGDDPIRLGASSLVTFTAIGTSTSGSLYLRGRKAQYVIRIFGETGKTRVLRFNAPTRQWKPL